MNTEKMNEFTKHVNRLIDKNFYGELDTFLTLPKRAQDIIWAAINSEKYNHLPYVMGLDTSECKSPIEKIFYVAFSYLIEVDYAGEESRHYSLHPQFSIEVGSRTYIADFYVEFDNCNCDLKLTIECDGHDFHEKTKEQVSHDNERQLAIKSAGYDVIRFSGSQIVKNPLKCALDAIKYIDQNVERCEETDYQEYIEWSKTH